MNKKTKILASSIATIAMTASLAVGGTFALFTSEDKVNIAVSSGTVNVDAVTSELTLYSNGQKQTGDTFAVGGKATKVGNTITLDRIVPMDSVEFDIDIVNYSNVTVQYRTVIYMVEDTGLFEALDVTFEENGATQTFTGGYAYADWKKLTPGDDNPATADDVTTIGVTVEFPNSDQNQNQYQGKSCKFAVLVEAVQGNASVVNPVTQKGARSWEINSEEGMMLMNGLIASTSHGEGVPLEFKLTDNMDMTGYTWNPPAFWFVNIDGDGHKISNLNCGFDDWGRSGFVGYAGGATFKNITFENVKSEGTQVGVLAGAFEGGMVENVTIAGTNTVKYNAAINPEETWGGAGVVFGVAQYVNANSSITIANGATVTVDYNNMITSAPLQNAYAQINDISAVVTKNGTVTENGTPLTYIANGFSQDKTGAYVITNAEGLKYFAAKVNAGTTYENETVKLANNIDLNNEAWTPIGANGDKAGFQGTFDGQNKTIFNLNVNQATRAYQSAGLFGSARYATIKNFTVDGATIVNLDDAGNTSNGAAVVVGSAQYAITISNVKVLNATVTSNRRVSAIAGYFVGTIENCYVENVSLTATFDDLGNGEFDNADKVGTFIAYSNGASTITGNEAKNVTLKGYRDIGGIAGYATTSTLTNNKIDGLALNLDNTHNYKNYTTTDAYDIETIIGEGTADATNVATNVLTSIAEGLYKSQDGETVLVANNEGFVALNQMLVAATNVKWIKAVELMADIDMTGKTWTAVDLHIDAGINIQKFNGNGHTISNMTIAGQAMFKRVALGAGVNFEMSNITFDKATVNSGTLNTAVVIGQTYNNTLFDNVDVKNSTVKGAYKVAPFIATVYDEKTTAITATLKNCDVENTKVTCTSYDFCTAGMVAFVYEGNNDRVAFENCSVKNVELYAKPNGYTSHAAVYVNDADTDDCFNEVTGVTVENVTFTAI